MRLIYLDESARANEFYFFGALIADALAVKTIERGIGEVATLIGQNVKDFDPAAEFHAVDMFHGKGAWRPVPIAWRVKACDLAAKVIRRSTARFVFRGIDLAALRAKYHDHAYPAHLLTLAHTLEEVDRHIGRLDHPDYAGLVLADEHHSAPDARRNLRNFKLDQVPGYTSQRLARIADTIYFGPSSESRLLQAADVATFFINRVRTVAESDPRQARAIAKIVANIRAVTLDEWVWRP